ncbi:hypothetical protein EJ05DRAFT_337435 [Pseudovirgaria hyperparasitica]|uniref:Uncharacterized protein n=1 Tax=Pseudovirgaria hyperparasitica TaxID=470096 RepID=A0A6A6WB80_9PEZI|nr:uncharacterized protein EJ05DRAFT_337435 [Pseudovirgaria hyperparasitica]KAF2759220.1 hypothetical protein EJ05DRAFT_337435 [Pseudovirgaria hyperparasitica]
MFYAYFTSGRCMLRTQYTHASQNILDIVLDSIVIFIIISLARLEMQYVYPSQPTSKIAGEESLWASRVRKKGDLFFWPMLLHTVCVYALRIGAIRFSFPCSEVGWESIGVCMLYPKTAEMGPSRVLHLSRTGWRQRAHWERYESTRAEPEASVGDKR